MVEGGCANERDLRQLDVIFQRRIGITDAAAANFPEAGEAAGARDPRGIWHREFLGGLR